VIFWWRPVTSGGGGDSTNPGVRNVAKNVPYMINGIEYVGELPPCCLGPVEGLVLNEDIIGLVCSSEFDNVVGEVDGTCTGDIIGLVSGSYDGVIGLVLNDEVIGLVTC
jgi:hypothetical protein